MIFHRRLGRQDVVRLGVLEVCIWMERFVSNHGTKVFPLFPEDARF